MIPVFLQYPCYIELILVPRSVPVLASFYNRVLFCFPSHTTMAESKTQTKVQIEHSDPLFLHPSDHPGQVLAADIFNGEDFDNWRRSVMIALSAKHKTAFIDGTYGKPDSSSPLLPYWKRCNDMVLSWLLNSMHKNIWDSVIFCETASEIWKELEERYGQSNKARLFQAHKEVCCISQGDLDIASYFNRAKKL